MPRIGGAHRQSLEKVKKKLDSIYGKDKKPTKRDWKNPSSFEITASDASAGRVPQSGIEEIRPGNMIDVMVEADSDYVRAWLHKLGDYLVHYEKQGSRSQQHYVLKAFPKGYKLFIHKKGVRHNPRIDAYLFGSSWVSKFRSPEEFVFHAKWLEYGMPKSGGRPQCMCHYCSGAPQGEITSVLKSATRHLHPVQIEPRETILAGSARGGEDGQRRRATQVAANEPVQAKDYTRLGTGPTHDVPRWTQNTGGSNS